ncbi:hypothetical protein [Deinococcus sp.]|uniref:hypothetical protein n=1 Tax=Deinococcus sp. TaxID=47478 RepID=UPI00286DAA88|nr:hypothetical protein [Deinococcus sp.]
MRHTCTRPFLHAPACGPFDESVGICLSRCCASQRPRVLKLLREIITRNGIKPAAPR